MISSSVSSTLARAALRRNVSASASASRTSRILLHSRSTGGAIHITRAAEVVNTNVSIIRPTRRQWVSSGSAAVKGPAAASAAQHHPPLAMDGAATSSTILEDDDNDNNDNQGAATSTNIKHAPQQPQPSMIKDIMELSKFRLSALVVSTTSAGFLAAGASMGGMASTSGAVWPTLASCCIGTALCSSSASTWNQIIEVERDRQMKRTRHRPLVRGSVTQQQAIGLASLTSLGGGTLLAVGTDPVTTALGLGNIALYAGLYTYLKPRMEFNTWVGAFVGAIPPVMGWTAAGGSIWDVEALLLGGMLYLWQMPHFFALAYMHRADYARGGFQMVPVNDHGDTIDNDDNNGDMDGSSSKAIAGDRTASLITRYTWYLSTIPVASYALDVTSSMFALEGLVLNAYALHVAYKFNDDRTNANARKVFLTSLWYLPCLMTLFILHSKTWDVVEEGEEKEQDKLFKAYKDTVQAIRQKGRGVCIHEVLISKDEHEHTADAQNKDKLCPFTVAGKENIIHTSKNVAQNATEAVTMTATAVAATTVTAAADKI
jgi:protoheme IX farnesyltransferase